MINDAAGLYLRDLGTLVKELAIEARSTARESGDLFETGRAMAFYEVISLMIRWAVDGVATRRGLV